MPESKKNDLINWELISTNPSDKNWNWKDIFFYWSVNVQSIIGFSLIASLFLLYQLNTCNTNMDNGGITRITHLGHISLDLIRWSRSYN